MWPHAGEKAGSKMHEVAHMRGVRVSRGRPGGTFFKRCVCSLALVTTMLLSFILAAPPAFADTSGTRNAGTGTDVPFGDTAWTSSGNITAVGPPYATVTLAPGNDSHYLQATNYGFSIPAGATINGVEVFINRTGQQSAGFGFRDEHVFLVKGGVIQTGSDKAHTGSNWPTSFAAATYGSASDVWGQISPPLTPADVNSANFGVALVVHSNLVISTLTATVDYVQIRVTYTPVPTVGFASTSSSGSENTTPADLAVNLSAPSANTVTVDYAVTGGTATGGGVDYALAGGTLIFSPGVTSRNIAIAVVNDSIGEPNETVLVTLSSSSNATLGATPVHTYTINDDDVPGITVSPTAGLVTTEAGGTAQFTIVLTSQPSANVTIGLTSSDLTEGVVSPSSVTFAPGNWSTPRAVIVTGVPDGIVDGNIAYNIVTAPASSADGNYSGMNAGDIGVTNDDIDSFPPPDTTAPAAVSNLATTGPTQTSITLTWTAPGDDGSDGHRRHLRYSLLDFPHQRRQLGGRDPGDRRAHSPGGRHRRVLCRPRPERQYHLLLRH